MGSNEPKWAQVGRGPKLGPGPKVAQGPKFEFENLDFEIKYKNPQGLGREKISKMILESSFWTLTTSILNLKITTEKADRQTKSGQHSSMRLTKLKNESSIKSTTTRAINSALHPRRQGYKQELTETDRLIA